MSDEARFYAVGTVAGGPQWGTDKRGQQTLEARISVVTVGARGQQYEDVLQVRVRRGDLQAEARKLVPGARVAVFGSVGGRVWRGERGERLYTDLNAEAIIPQGPPGQARPLEFPEVPPPPVITDADLRIPAPAPVPDYSDTPF
jgi:hypothetical protein